MNLHHHWERHLKNLPGVSQSILFVCTVLSAFYAVWMLKQNIRLDQMLKTPIEQDLEIGDFVPPLNITDDKGDQQPVLLPDRARLLIIASATCDMCKDFLNQWWPIIQEEPSLIENAPVIVYTDELKYVLEGSAPTGFFYNGERAFRRAFRAYTVPLILLLSPEGKVINLYRGTLTVDQYNQLKVSTLKLSTLQKSTATTPTIKS